MECIYGIYSYNNFKGCHTRIVSAVSNTHQIGIYITIRLDENPIGLVGYMCAAPPSSTPPAIYMTPGHRIGGESERFGWIYVPPPPPRQAYQYTSRQVLNQHRISGESERLGRLYLSPLPITTPPIHITPGLKSTSDWWHFRAVRSDFHDSNPAGNRAIRKNTETRNAAGYERFPIGFLCLPSGCFNSRQLNGEKPVTERCVFTQCQYLSDCLRTI